MVGGMIIPKIFGIESEPTRARDSAPNGSGPLARVTLHLTGLSHSHE